MTYVLLSLFWTLAGLVVGYWLGSAGRLEKPLEGSMTATTTPARGGRVFGVLLIVLALLSVIVGTVSIENQRVLVERQAAITTCQNEYNRQFASALTERNDAAAREREGQRRLLEESFRPQAERDPAELTTAYQQYLAVLAETDAQRDANPLPVRVC